MPQTPLELRGCQLSLPSQQKALYVQDPEAFEQDGGWNFLDMEGEDEEDEDEEEEGDPEFEAESDASEEAASSDYRHDHAVQLGCLLALHRPLQQGAFYLLLILAKSKKDLYLLLVASTAVLVCGTA